MPAYAQSAGVEVSAQARALLELESRTPDTNFAQSLTRDFLFFVTFVGQVVLFLIFFWEKPMAQKRWNVGEEAAQEQQNEEEASQRDQASSSRPVEPQGESLAPVEKAQVSEQRDVFFAPPEGSRAISDEARASAQLDEAFEPLESTIRDLQHRISGLERTLNRRKGTYPTESLKLRLRDCISTITNTLGTLEAQAPISPTAPVSDPVVTEGSLSPHRIDITRWPVESIQTSKRQLELQLEQLEAGVVMKDGRESPSAALLADKASLDELSAALAAKVDDHPPAHSESSSKTESTPVETPKKDPEGAPPQVAPPTGSDTIEDQELEMLAAQLMGPKKGRKGGKVKISAKDMSAFSFLAESENVAAPPVDDSKPLPELSLPSNFDFPSDKDSPTPEKIPDSPTEKAPEAETKDVPTPDSPKDTELPDSPKQDHEHTETDKIDNTKPEEEPKVEAKSEADEVADLARLMAAAPGKKKGGAKAHAEPTLAVPANIFNMFAPLSTDTPTSKGSPRSPSPASDVEHDKTDDLLAALEGVKSTGAKDDVSDLLSGLDDLKVPDDLAVPSDLSLPSDFSLPSDNNDGNQDKRTLDLLAALNAVSMPKEDTESDDSDENDSSESDSGSESEESGETSSEEEEDDDTRPVVKEFSASEALNKSGLQRAKKSVPMNKGGKKGSYQMEDFHFCAHPWIEENWALFCVMDGHSGKDCAETASKILPEILAKKMQTVNLEEEGGFDLTDILTQTFLETDDGLKEYEYEGSTCTVVVVYKQAISGKRYLQAANVGDSSAVLVRKGKADAITVDHHPNYPHEIARLAEMGIVINPGQTRLNGLAISRALGDHFPKSTDCGLVAKPSVSELIELNSKDSHLILASDGLWDVVSFQRAYDIISPLDSVSEMSDTLLKTATRSSKCTDNVTTIVVTL